MALWKIVPIANKDDAAWLDHPIWDEVVVRAPTSAQARVLASEMERHEKPDTPPPGNESLAFQSAFENATLYAVRPLDPATEPAISPEGPDEVVRSTKDARSPRD